MTDALENLLQHLSDELGATLRTARLDRGELTVELSREGFSAACLLLRDDAACAFDLLVDVCGVDYSAYGEGLWEGPRFAVVYHLLSLKHRQRLRVRIFADDDLPIVPSVVEVWAAANWFEREAFDLYGVLFDGHPDLRRILTDYGFVGHPFRKDFPLVGTVEMRYDADQGRVVYEPTRTEERVVVPRIIREAGEGRYNARNQ
ncbi:NADH-quinone oxidoreductase subunit C [Acidithiobacillus sp. 'AMD consortium']|jgi:NADH-quinone oxidoreductase subunit C|uniref:NADH-quinone oxidoreductase subunit C n=2 Tax=Acidithiobacillus ferridurans TaxID=1232575 RepID=A0A8X8K791_ACIFI|nr:MULTISPECIES: NADH-quinone oxidoreductase subunit C [Acidithiobacillus]MBU2716325.1 NADH-quinone oxidoreductase subunit C [Acidithiobacillus ferridurans]MBU2721686.1 NADH-quinone oxidoreductase subunit C [Acidithiobacillus ferridurans]MBU2725547.1 NADH-quinone oxidoreductase subunit C [Acidithiobacillus ferridurans]QFG79304.1 NADH-quinone oxidoreductase subunit C [Acidithiobacillus sp. 'AMD consortium']RBM02210.1 NADH-quinone oxidoreductase subunit C [Acidithiobacillus ferridurans]